MAQIKTSHKNDPLGVSQEKAMLNNRLTLLDAAASAYKGDNAGKLDLSIAAVAANDRVKALGGIST